jgi:hypothetical protein
MDSQEMENGSFDNMIAGMMENIAEFLGEAVQDESFAGCSTKTSRDEDGKLIGLEFVFCEMKDGEPVRRSVKTTSLDMSAHKAIITNV